MKNYISISILILTLSVLSACKVSKDVETPKPALPETFRSAATTGDTSSIADIQWKQFFTEATLQKLIDSAIVKNYDMQIAVKNIEASQLLFKQVKWNNVPQVDLNVTASSSRPSDNSINGLTLSQISTPKKAAPVFAAGYTCRWHLLAGLYRPKYRAKGY